MRLCTVAFASAFALVALPKMARGQQCAPHAPGGLVATDGHGGMLGSIALTRQSVVLSWVEARPWDRESPLFGGPGASRWIVSRTLSRTSLAFDGPAQPHFRPQSSSEIGLGPVALATPAGTPGVGFCTCFGGSGDFGCAVRSLDASPNVTLAPRRRSEGVCPQGRIAAATGGTDTLLWVPTPMESLRAYGTAVRSLREVPIAGEIQAPVGAALDAGRFAFAHRSPQGLELRVFRANGQLERGPVLVSTAGTEVGAPTVLAQGAAVLVVYAERRGRAPWALVLARVEAGRPVTRTTLHTGTAAAMAPSLAASSDPRCVLLSFTEGSGRATVARVGRVCDGALEASSLAQLSQPGVEAGESELVSDGREAWALWQELPAAPSARAELRVARLGCR